MTAGATILLISCGYWAALILAALRYRADEPSAGTQPPISVFIPAVGERAKFADNLRHHAAQQYPNFEILVGVGESDELTSQAVERVRGEFQDVRIEVVTCGSPPLGVNPKVAVLEQLARQAGHPVWVIADADIEVPPDYLDSLATALENPAVGLVTCLFHAVPGRSLPSAFEALWINCEFMGQVLLARSAQGMKFALGATVAFRRAEFEKLGGFSTVRDFIGDDYVLGEAFNRAGREVAVCSREVATHLPGYTFGEAWRHQLRWSRTIRSQRPAGHLGLFFTFGSVWVISAIALCPTQIWPLAAITLGMRYLAGLAVARASGAPLRVAVPALLPLVDICAFTVWLASFFSNRVTWAGKIYRLGSNGRILP